MTTAGPALPSSSTSFGQANRTRPSATVHRAVETSLRSSIAGTMQLPPARASISRFLRRRLSVKAFHAAALKSGGTDNWGPVIRPHQGANHFAAFIVDPDGHRLEA